MKAKKFKMVMAYIGMVMTRLAIIGLAFVVGCAISEILYESCDWWYADAWELGLVTGGLQMMTYLGKLAKHLDWKGDNIYDDINSI